MRILVTGGAGFIGSHYVRTMLNGGFPEYADARITVLDKLSYAGNRENLPAVHPLLTFVRGSVCDRTLLRDLVPGHDAVVHFAAESHVDRSITAADAFIQTNVAGTQALLDSCQQARVARVVHVSTDEVYGTIRAGSWTEGAPLLPNSPYAASKAAADLMVRAAFKTHQLDVSVTRCTNNYGPYQHPEKFLPLSITNLLQGSTVPLYGDGQHIREWLHVADHCQAIHLVLTKGRAGQIYNVGGGAGRTNRSLAEQVVRLCGADPAMISHVADRKGHDRRYSVDDSKIRRELGYAPCVRFDDGLADTVAWYRDNVHWWKAVKYRLAAAP